MEHYNEIDFNVPLSGSKLFDMSVESTARGLCAKFPGLQYERIDRKTMHIFGKLNDYWFEQYNKAVFEIGGSFWKE